MSTKPVWKDITTFSQSDKERKPSVWEMRVPSGLRIVILSSYIGYSGQWVMHCEPWYNTYLLKDAKYLEEAQGLAVFVVRSKVAELYKELAGI